jgi:hypothetical protein
MLVEPARVRGCREDRVAQGALYDVVLLAHVASGLVGYGSVAATGYYAAEARRLEPLLAARGDPPPDAFPAGGPLASRSARVRRYFSPGANLAARLVYLVPVLGAVLVAEAGKRSWLGQPWLLGALSLWVLSAGVAQFVLWPAETDLQDLLSGAGEEDSPPLSRAARRVELAAVVMSLCYLVAFVLMVAQPG